MFPAAKQFYYCIALTAFLFLFFSDTNTFGQVADSETACLEFAEEAYEQQHYNEARQLYQQAAANALKEGNYLCHTEALRKAAYCLLVQLDYGSAEAELRAVLQNNLARQGERQQKITGEIYYNLAQTFLYRGITDSAGHYYTQSLKTLSGLAGQPVELLAQALLGMGDFYKWMKEDPFLAEKYYQQALALFNNFSYKGQERLIMRIYYNLAAVHRSKRDEQKALSAFFKMKDLLDSLGTHNVRIPAFAESCYGGLANCYSILGNHKNARNYYLKAIETSKAYYGENNYSLVNYYNNLGMLEASIKNIASARKSYQKAVAIASAGKKDYQSLRNLTDSYQYTGDSYILTVQPDSAILFYRKSLEVLYIIYEKETTVFAPLYSSLSGAYLLKQHTDSALHYSTKALALCTNGYEQGQPFSQSMIPENADFYSIAEAMNSMATSLKEHWQQPGNAAETAMLLEAVNLHMIVDSLTMKQREQFSRESSELSFSASQHKSYESALETMFLLYKQSNGKKGLAEAFKLMEHSKSQLLYRSLNSLQGYYRTAVPDSLVNYERQLEFKISRLNSKRGALAEGSAEIEALEQEIYELDRQTEALKNYFKTNYSSYYELKYSDTYNSLPALQQILQQENSMLAEYFWGDENLYLLMVSGKQQFFYSMPVTPELSQEVGLLQQLLLKGYAEEEGLADYLQYTRIAHSLYSQLLQPAIAAAGELPARLVVVPDGPLSYLPFDALLYKKADKDKVDYRNLPYIINNLEVSYSFSASLLKNEHASQKEPNSTDNSLLAFSFSTDADKLLIEQEDTTFNFELVRDGISASVLAGTSRELDAIKRYFTGEFYKGNEALEHVFKTRAEEFDILHLALHGLADLENPFRTCLVFQKKEQGEAVAGNARKDDGVLFAWELYAMRIKARLAILSACETGIGKTFEGEGMFSMGRAFAYAGCPTVIMSLWSINDQITARLMSNFYGSIHEGQSSVTSLNTSKRAYLQQADEYTAHPYYWAALVNIGPEVNFAPAQDHKKMPLTLLAVAIAAVAAFFIYRRVSARVN